MPPEEQDPSQGAPGAERPAPQAVDPGETGAKPAEPAAATTREQQLEATLVAARKAVEDTTRAANEREARYAKLVETIVMPRADERPVERVEEETLPEGMTPEMLALIERKAAAIADRALGVAKKTYDTDREQDLTFKANVEEERAFGRHRDLVEGREERKTLREEVRVYLQQLPVAFRSDPQVVDTAYLAVLGQKTAEKERAERARAASVAPSARGASYALEGTRAFTNEEKQRARNVNPSLTDADLDLFSGPVDINAYKAAQAKRTGGAR